MKEQTTMKKHARAVKNDLNILADDARALISATADATGDQISDARNRVAAALDGCREVYDQVLEKGIDGARAADRSLRRNPYEAVAIALGVGALIGFLLARK